MLITAINRRDKVSASGKKYESVSIKVKEYGDTWINGFGNVANKRWQEGDDADIIVTTVKVGDKEYLNFEMKKAEKTGGVDLTLLKAEFLTLNAKLDEIKRLLTAPQEVKF